MTSELSTCSGVSISPFLNELGTFFVDFFKVKKKNKANLTLKENYRFIISLFKMAQFKAPDGTATRKRR